ncbi:RecX family transcriptional regulator [Panacibacter ginsenosidivorans]|uniref:Regulatory protein RecX n=1 Tax=Panacibacter ginsenosidivorans TaxID=1813871 RepID=A0A5B8VGR7_9BACT|nr:regulatory protein RecX [Panacibacter ginsenosidivorans]QEC70205.1 RecX family transcriptional regulator [Panacibacter ginsenosidivorans]
MKKLYSFGLHKTEVDEILGWLIESNYLNEERFAILFAGGKFRIKKWGRIKIRQALLQHRISNYNINTALNNIDELAYMKTLQRLASVKWQSLKTDTVLVKKMKTTRYLLQKGYERPLIVQTLSILAFP